jgi:hypothetical protein
MKQVPADLYDPRLINAMYLEDILRGVHPNRDNLGHGKHPMMATRSDSILLGRKL